MSASTFNFSCCTSPHHDHSYRLSTEFNQRTLASPNIPNQRSGSVERQVQSDGLKRYLCCCVGLFMTTCLVGKIVGNGNHSLSFGDSLQNSTEVIGRRLNVGTRSICKTLKTPLERNESGEILAPGRSEETRMLR